MAYDGHINIDSALDAAGIKKGLDSINGVIATGAKAAVAAVAGIGAAFAGITVASLKMGGDLEQSLGGIETMFKGSSGKVIDYANNAFMTAGLSANAYMEQVTSFSASLLQGLGGDTEKAADIAHMAMVDMSDNANKFGTDIGAIQNAYQGFAKDNFTMLDNLKLGYGGTAEEMARLVNESGVLNGEFEVTAESVKDIPFDTLIQAIHSVQEEMGVIGTTSKEAMETLNGSISATKAAWENFLTGVGSSKALVDTVSNTADIIMDRLGEIIPRLVETLPAALDGLIAKAGEMFPALQPMIDSFYTIKQAVIDSGLFQNIADLLARIGEKAAGILLSDVFTSAVVAVIEGLSSAAGFLADNLDTILAVIVPLTAAFAVLKAGMAITGIIAALTSALSAAGGAAAFFGGALAAVGGPVTLIIAAIAALVAGVIYLWNTNDGFRNALISAWEAISSTAQAVWGAIVTFFTETIPNAFNAALQWFMAIGNSIVTTVNGVWTSIISFFTETIPSWIGSVITWFQELPYNIGLAIGTAIGHVIQFGADIWSWVTTELPAIIEGVIEWFAQLPGRIGEWLAQTITDIATWGANMLTQATTAASNAINAVIEWFSQLPSKVWEWLTQTITNIVTWGADMITKAKEAATNMVTGVVETIQALPGKMLEIGSNIVQGIWDGITGMAEWIKGKVSDFVGGIVDGIKGVLGIASPSKVFADEVGAMIPAGIGEGMDAGMPSLTGDAESQMGSLANGMNSALASSIGQGAQQVVSSVQSMSTTVQNTFKTLSTQAQSIVTQMMSNINSAVVTRTNTIKSSITALINAVVATLNELPTKGPALATQMMTNINSAIISRTTTVKASATAMVNGIIDSLNTMVSKAVAVTNSMMSGMYNAMEDRADNLYDLAETIADNIADTMAEALDVNSPSRVMYRLFENVMMGIFNGMDDMSGLLYRKAGDIADGLADRLAVSPDVFGGLFGRLQGLTTATPLGGSAQLLLATAGASEGAGNTIYSPTFVQNITTPKPLSPSEMVREQQDLIRRSRWQLP